MWPPDVEQSRSVKTLRTMHTKRPTGRFGVTERPPGYQNIKFNIRKALTVEESVCTASGSSFPASTATSSHLISSTSGDAHNHNTVVLLTTPLLWIFRVRWSTIVCKCLYFLLTTPVFHWDYHSLHVKSHQSLIIKTKSRWATAAVL